jgi:hypothetical protein
VAGPRCIKLVRQCKQVLSCGQRLNRWRVVPKYLPARLVTNEARANSKPYETAAVAAAALGVVFAGSMIPTPLNPLYQTAFDFSGLTLTLIYAGHVLGSVAVLLLVDGLADRIGRRRMVLPRSPWLAQWHSRVGADLARSTLQLVCWWCGRSLRYRGSLGPVNLLAPNARRSEVISSYLIAIYCGNSLPVIGVSLVSTFTSLTIAHVIFVVVIALLAVFALFESRPDAGLASCLEHTGRDRGAHQ